MALDPNDRLASYDTATKLLGPGAWPGLRILPLPMGIAAGQFVLLNPAPSATAVIVEGNVFPVPFDLAEPDSFDQLLFEVVTTPGSAGSVVRGGIWLDDGTLRRPGNLLYDLGTVATTTTGVKTLTIPGSGPLPQGRLWAACVPQGAPATNPTLRTTTAAFRTVPHPLLTNLTFQFLQLTSPLMTGALTSPFPAVNSASSVAVAMALRAA